MIEQSEKMNPKGVDQSTSQAEQRSLFLPITDGRALGRLFVEYVDPKESNILPEMREAVERLARVVSAARMQGFIAAPLRVESEESINARLTAASSDETVAPERESFTPREFEWLRSSNLLVDGTAIPEADVPAMGFHPYVTDGERLYTERAFTEERECARLVLERLRATPAVLPDPKRMDAFLEERARESADAVQTEAVVNAARSGFAIIAGGPGTGKTTSVANLLSLFASENEGVPLRIRLMAPTGKAAARLTESLAQALTEEAVKEHPLRAELRRMLLEDRLPSRTIEKWLLTRTSEDTTPDKRHPMEADIIVVDEASMIDAATATRLFEAVSPLTRLILLGDAHQLAAVGPGAVFAELTSYEAERAYAAVRPEVKVVSRLVKSHRYPDNSQIHAVAEAIKSGDAEALKTKLIRPSSIEAVSLRELLKADEARRECLRKARAGEALPFVAPAITVEFDSFAEQGKSDRIGIGKLYAYAEASIQPYVEAMLALLERFVREGGVPPEAPQWRHVERALLYAKVLCATRSGVVGVDALNRRLELAVVEALLSHWPGDESEGLRTYWLRARDRLRAGRSPVAYPGRIVIVRQNDDRLGVANGDVSVVLPDASGAPELVRLPSGADVPLYLLPAYDPAFAMTIHQSQGSEFDRVAVVLPERASSPLAMRELLYTGVTRAKSSVLIFGTIASLEASTVRATVRVSGLAARLLEESQHRNGSINSGVEVNAEQAFV